MLFRITRTRQGGQEANTWCTHTENPQERELEQEESLEGEQMEQMEGSVEDEQEVGLGMPEVESIDIGEGGEARDQRVEMGEGRPEVSLMKGSRSADDTEEEGGGGGE